MCAKETSVKEALEGMLTGESEPKTVEEELRALRAQVVALQQQLTPTLRRSQMKDKDKYDFIRKHGASEYLKLPWD